MGNLTQGGTTPQSSGANYVTAVAVLGAMYEGEFLSGMSYRGCQVGLFQASGGNLVEVNWPGYVRGAFTGGWHINSGVTPPVFSNGGSISWTGQSGWGTVAGIGLILVNPDSPSDPGIVFAVTPISPVVMGPGVTLTIQTGQLQFYFD